MLQKKFILLLGILILGCIPTHSQTLKEKAESGDKVAQFEYAGKLENWYPKEKDYKEAVSWLQKSANQGYAPAQCNLGYHYSNGIGIQVDKVQAVYWYRKAAEQGDATAQYNLGVCYSNGEGVNKSETSAFAWYKKSAEQGDASAEFSVGRAYYYGEGVSQNNKIAMEWFTKAANHKHARAMYYIGECYANGRGVEKNMSEAINWYEKSADGDDTEAEYKLALLYFEGNGVEKDTIVAVDYLLHSAGGGWLQPNIIYSYDKENANSKAEKKLLELCSLTSSQYLHYYLAIEGYLCDAKHDFVKAEKYYKEAIEQGSILGTIELGLMYFYISANTPQLYKYYDYDWDGNEAPKLGLESYMFSDNSACIEYAKNKKWTEDDNPTYWLEKAVQYGVGSFQYGAMGYTLYDHLIFAYVDCIGTKENLERAIDISSLYLSDTTVDEGLSYNVQPVYELALEKPKLQSKVFSLCRNLYSEYKIAHNKKYNESITITASILGKCYYKGIGTPKDYNLAFVYLLEAASGHDCECMRLLSACYRYGRGTSVNKTKEMEWFEKADKCGDEKARQVKELRKNTVPTNKFL